MFEIGQRDTKGTGMSLQDAIDTIREFTNDATAGRLSEGDLIYAPEAADEIEKSLHDLRAALVRVTA